jgi:hypothetical protein
MLPDEKKAVIHVKNSTQFFIYNVISNKMEKEFHIKENPKDVIFRCYSKFQTVSETNPWVCL